MRGLRTVLAVGILSLAIPAMAIPVSPTERARVFADCAGRLQALEEHQRLFDGPASERTASLKHTFLDLLAAVLPDARAHGLPKGHTLNLRISARAAQRTLLSTATFAPDPLSRAPAEARAAERIATCKGLLLGA